jgi:hypothetical protein
MGQTVDTKFIVETKSGSLVKQSAQLDFGDDGKIYFLKSPFALKDDIKAMQGARWHGYDPENPRKVWSIKDTLRNRTQLQIMMGNDPFEWFNQEVKTYDYSRPLRDYQQDMTNHWLTYHYEVWAVEMGCGKTLSAIDGMEKSGRTDWFWVGPKSGIMAVEREFKKWGISNTLNVKLLTYEGLVKLMKGWDGSAAPHGVVFDEASRLKNAASQRSQAAQALADGIRREHGNDGYVLLMSGTPAPKSPVDWWALCEVTWPGWLKEGHPSAFEKRLAFIVNKDGPSGTYPSRIGWKDDDRKCSICGQLFDNGPHDELAAALNGEYHQYTPSINECSYLHERLTGLVIIKQKKDCLDLPEKQYRTVLCPPTPTTLRVAHSIAKNAPNVITGLTWLRELSDGFQYRDKVVGMTKCPACTDGTRAVWVDPDDDNRTYDQLDLLDAGYVATLKKEEWPCDVCGGSLEVEQIERTAREVPCPKEPALIDLLEENEETGRVVIFAGFTGSVDRVTGICQSRGWDVVRMDGRGAHVFDTKNNQITGDPLDYWADLESHPRVAFVAHPKSGGMALTLTEARMAIYWSNSYEPESRAQSEDRIHRMGMDMNKGATIVDLIHLPTDESVIKILKDNRRLELMTMGEVTQGIAWGEEHE